MFNCFYSEIGARIDNCISVILNEIVTVMCKSNNKLYANKSIFKQRKDNIVYIYYRIRPLFFVSIDGFV